MRRFLPGLLAACLGCCLFPKKALGHDARPLSILIVEGQERVYRVDMRMPPSIDAANRPSVAWPRGCTVTPGGFRNLAGSAGLETMRLSCAAGLEGQRIEVQYKLFNPSLSTLFRLRPASGKTLTAVLAPDETEWLVPAASSWRTVAHDYLVLGIKHIWAGIDHLLFVTGLILLAGSARRIALAVTGFTVAHSVTLSLSALELVRLPLAPIEATIALSILFLAREIARPNPDSLARRYPLAASSSFGLLHGFGFAAALTEAGLAANELAVALLFFNLGVEAGQLVFIGVVVAIAFGAARLAGSWAGPALKRLEVCGAYVMGIPASYWLFERLRDCWFR